jgi:carboxylate-amine ligase
LSARNQPNEPPSADALRSAFDGAAPFTVGIEDEVMLLDPQTHELAPRALEVVSGLDGDPRFKLELPASQVEIVTTPAATVPEAAAQLIEARRVLAGHAEPAVRPAGAGVPPLGSGIGQLNRLEAYEHTIEEYGPIARRQLVGALQVHVSVPGADRALAVYNAARSFLPWLAALAANGAFYAGHDSGLASVRPKLGELLPRQGVPPAISSWEDHADALAWGVASGTSRVPRTWWWELRPHPRFGTLEFRVPDAQATVADAAGVAAVAQALTAWLADRHDSGEELPVAASWRIEENRWSACRHGVEGTMADLDTGEARPTRARLEELIELLGPVAGRLGAGDALEEAARLTDRNGALVQRQVSAAGGASAVARSLAERFLEPWPG